MSSFNGKYPPPYRSVSQNPVIVVPSVKTPFPSSILEKGGKFYIYQKVRADAGPFRDSVAGQELSIRQKSVSCSSCSVVLPR